MLPNLYDIGYGIVVDALSVLDVEVVVMVDFAVGTIEVYGVCRQCSTIESVKYGVSQFALLHEQVAVASGTAGVDAVVIGWKERVVCQPTEVTVLRKKGSGIVGISMPDCDLQDVPEPFNVVACELATVRKKVDDDGRQDVRCNGG
jgi:hypothetical protein